MSAEGSCVDFMTATERARLVVLGEACVRFAKRDKAKGDGYLYDISSSSYKKAAADLDEHLEMLRSKYPKHILPKNTYRERFRSISR